MVSIIDDEYSVTKYPPGDYWYVKWWDNEPIPQAWTKAKEKVEAASGA